MIDYLVAPRPPASRLTTAHVPRLTLVILPSGEPDALALLTLGLEPCQACREPADARGLELSIADAPEVSA